MRSKEQNPDEPSLEENKTASPDVHDQTRSDKASKPSRKLFAFLSCCSSSDVDPEDGSIPPKKTPSRLSVVQTQPTPEKADINAADSSTAESKAPSYFKDEKPNMTVTSDKQSSYEEGAAEQSSQFDGTKTTPVIPESVQNQTSSSTDTETRSADTQSPIQPGTVAAEPTMVEEPDENTAEDQETENFEASTQPAVTEVEPKQLPRDDEAVRLPPPPPLGKQPETSVQERAQQWLLPPALPHLRDRKCLVLDLDETLVHSSFKVLERADFTIPVEIEGQYHNIYVIKRPGVDQFMKRVGELYEVVVFTASVSKVGLCTADQSDINLLSMVILYWTSWTFMVSSTTGCSEIVATTTKATTSRISLRLAVTSGTLSSLITPQRPIYFTLNMRYPSAAGSLTPTITSFSTLFLFLKTLPVPR
ncbi:hypothetical protein BDW67DRAFT_6664 [Aspergillus spinulosporus]